MKRGEARLGHWISHSDFEAPTWCTPSMVAHELSSISCSLSGWSLRSLDKFSLHDFEFWSLDLNWIEVFGYPFPFHLLSGGALTRNCLWFLEVIEGMMSSKACLAGKPCVSLIRSCHSDRISATKHSQSSHFDQERNLAWWTFANRLGSCSSCLGTPGSLERSWWAHVWWILSFDQITFWVAWNGFLLQAPDTQFWQVCMAPWAVFHSENSCLSATRRRQYCLDSTPRWVSCPPLLPLSSSYWACRAE